MLLGHFVLGVFGCSQYCDSSVCSHHSSENGGFVKQGLERGRGVQAQTIKGKEIRGKSVNLRGKYMACGKETGWGKGQVAEEV